MPAPRRTKAEIQATPAEAVNSEIEAILNSAAPEDPIPDAPEPPDDLVKLPGGITRNGASVKTATVRELNGMDEEALSKALRSNNLIHFMDVLISRGTVSIGSEHASRDLLKSLLIGDRDELALAIRIATYGDKIDIENWECPHCKSILPISFSLNDEDDIPRRRLDNPADTVFEVELRKGAKAKVRLPNGFDQEYIFEDANHTTAQRNSRMLEKCVLSYTNPEGRETQVVIQPSIVLSLSIPDRQKIIAEIAKRQPGPRYNEVKFRHDECGNEVALALGVADLFRELVLFL